MRIARKLALIVLGGVIMSSGAALAVTGNPNPAGLLKKLAPAPVAEGISDGTSDVTPTDGGSPVTKTFGKVERSTEGCPEGFTGTHGHFVSQADDKRDAAHSPCGKPVQSIHEREDKTPKPERTAKPARTDRPSKTDHPSGKSAEHKPAGDRGHSADHRKS